MKSTTINTCKEMTAYSDYPPRADLPTYMHHRDMVRRDVLSKIFSQKHH